MPALVWLSIWHVLSPSGMHSHDEEAQLSVLTKG